MIVGQLLLSHNHSSRRPTLIQTTFPESHWNCTYTQKYQANPHFLWTLFQISHQCFSCYCPLQPLSHYYNTITNIILETEKQHRDRSLCIVFRPCLHTHTHTHTHTPIPTPTPTVGDVSEKSRLNWGNTFDKFVVTLAHTIAHTHTIKSRTIFHQTEVSLFVLTFLMSRVTVKQLNKPNHITVNVPTAVSLSRPFHILPDTQQEPTSTLHTSSCYVFRQPAGWRWGYYGYNMNMCFLGCKAMCTWVECVWSQDTVCPHVEHRKQMPCLPAVRSSSTASSEPTKDS
jgi:hypothetical protein